MTAAVCIGARPRNPHEERVLTWVVARWEATGLPVYVGDAPGPYNRSAARNAAAARVPDGTDVLVFANADTVYRDGWDVAAAVQHAADGGWVLSERYVETSSEWTARTLDADPSADIDDPLSSYERQLWESPAGFQVVPASWFADINGWDEGFGPGWGWEDAAFRDALDVLHARHTRIGWAVHLWHPRGPELAPSANRANRIRWFTRYRRAAAQKQERTRVALMRRAVVHRS